MKNIRIYIFASMLLAGCNAPGAGTDQAYSKKAYDPLSETKAKNPVEELKRVPSFANNKQSKRKVIQEKLSPNNRFNLLMRDEQSDIINIDKRLRIESIDDRMVKFDNGWILQYYLDKGQRVQFRKNKELRLRYSANFIGGAYLKSLWLDDPKDNPILHIVSTGSERPIRSVIKKEIVIAQTKREMKHLNNNSERVMKVQAVLNKKRPIPHEEVIEIKRKAGVYQLLLHRSVHYYPKGRDSFESPKFRMAYTITRM